MITLLRSRLAALALVLSLGAAGAGCLKMQMHWQLYPDGSGKVKMRAIVRPPMMPGMGAGRDPKEMEKRLRSASPFKDFEGLTIKPGTARSETKDGALSFYAEGYFADVNQVTRKGKPVMSFLKLSTGEYEAHYVGFDDERKRLPAGRGDGESLPGSDDGDKTEPGKADPGAGAPKGMEAMMRAMMKGFEAKLFLKMPAALTQTNVDKQNDRTALLKIDEKVLDDPAERQRVESLDGVRARCGEPNPEQAAEWEAFKKELAEVLEAAKAAPEGGDGPGGEKPAGEFPEEEK